MQPFLPIFFDKIEKNLYVPYKFDTQSQIAPSKSRAYQRFMPDCVETRRQFDFNA